MLSSSEYLKTISENTSNLAGGSITTSENMAQVGGTAVDTNSGNKSAGTQRVVLATDQPQLTSALKVDGSAVTQPVSLASVPSHAVTNAGTFAVQNAVRQYAGVPSTFTVGTSDQTVFTLAAGEIGFIQNLDDAALAVKKGASASTTSLSFILAAGSAADDGTGGVVLINDWVGAVSVAAMSGSPRYIAWKQAAS